MGYNGSQEEKQFASSDCFRYVHEPKSRKKKLHKQESDDYTWDLRRNRLSTTAKGR